MSVKKSAALAALPSMPTRSRSRNAAPQNCRCGCGDLTRGGNFIPGHDARLLGWAIRIDRGFSVEGISPGELKAAKAFIAGHDPKFDRHFPGGRKHGEAVRVNKGGQARGTKRTRSESKKVVDDLKAALETAKQVEPAADETNGDAAAG